MRCHSSRATGPLVGIGYCCESLPFAHYPQASITDLDVTQHLVDGVIWHLRPPLHPCPPHPEAVRSDPHEARCVGRSGQHAPVAHHRRLWDRGLLPKPHDQDITHGSGQGLGDYERGPGQAGNMACHQSWHMSCCEKCMPIRRWGLVCYGAVFHGEDVMMVRSILSDRHPAIDTLLLLY